MYMQVQGSADEGINAQNERADIYLALSAVPYAVQSKQLPRQERHSPCKSGTSDNARGQRLERVGHQSNALESPAPGNGWPEN
jgi:hypothetical protein